MPAASRSPRSASFARAGRAAIHRGPAPAIATIVSGPPRIVAMTARNTRHAVDVEATGVTAVRLDVHDCPGWTVTLALCAALALAGMRRPVQ